MTEPVRFRYVGQQAGEPLAGVAAGAERPCRRLRAVPNDRLRNALTQAEQQHGAGRLRAGGVERSAPEVVPADDHQQRRDQVRGVADQLERQLGEEGADAAGEIRRRRVDARC